jgi:hypothetical protein
MKPEIEKGFVAFCKAAMNLLENDSNEAKGELTDAFNKILKIEIRGYAKGGIPKNETPLIKWLWAEAKERPLNGPINGPKPE